MASFYNNCQVASSRLHFIHLYFLVILLISITRYPLASHCCHEEERNALLSFKTSLDDYSNRLSSWQQGKKHENCCNWHGITCSNDTFRVVSIDLRNKDLEDYYNQKDPWTKVSSDLPDTMLTGKFSASIFKLTHLEYLDLAYNDFQESQIPRQFSDLTLLTHLDLSFSVFSSSITTQFTNLSSLQFLDLSCQSFDYDYSPCSLVSPSTKWVRGLVNLKVLRLSGVDLYEAISSQENFGEHISYLSNLRSLICLTFHNLSRLSSLKMNHNSELTSPFPIQLANLTSLSILELSNCQLHGSLPYLPQLKELDVGGTLPSSFYNLSQLQYLDLSWNWIKEFYHPSISSLKSVYHIDLSSNNIKGSIPKSICENSSLQFLSLSYNNITGMIPKCISKLQNLRELKVAETLLKAIYSVRLNLDMRFNSDQHSLQPKFSLKYLSLSSCNLKGIFPISICKLTNLVELYLDKNSLTGTIPSCLFKLKYLRRILLRENKLYGPVPVPSHGIEEFDLSNNNFSGEISLELGTILSEATIFGLAGNELSGSIPFTLCATEPGIFSSTQFIDLSNNKLSGTIPSNFGYCGYLSTLKLGKNNLTGEVPNELKYLVGSMKVLQLNDNHLDGAPLKLINKFYELEFLNLANNEFEGSIPAALGSLQYLRFFSLRSNKFNGSIPEEITHLQKLQLLDLSLNNFSGYIPNRLGNLSGFITTNDLEYYYFGDDQLDVATKGIRTEIKKVGDYTSAIDLSCNHLQGNIPEEIGLLTLLYSLNLSHNHFSNGIPESIGNLPVLQSLDLSSNNLSGHIPQSLAITDTLAVLNLSSNNLSGKIPRGPHFDTVSIDGSAFSGNELLCGYPTEKLCEGDLDTSTVHANPANEFDEVDGEDAKEKLLFYACVAFGFVVGFWGLFLVLFLKKQKWWFPYWKIVDSFAVRIIGYIQKKKLN
ncbi:hypothetical protein MKW92_036835 [Papaver armeniacum]|nr:hypothetical protein MKW92_036835 [Papaver armeniacum]